MDALKLPVLGEVSPVVLLGGAVLALVLAKKAMEAGADVVAGVVTGDNAVTRSATDADGNRVTAYQGAGIAGTAGAVANAASGGTLASIGGWLGRKVYDLTHSDEPAAPAPSATPTAAAAVTAAPNPTNASFQDQSQATWNWSGWTGWGAVQ